MTYNQALTYIHSLNRFGIKPGLQRITALLQRLGNPQDALSCIHVAGTNGKGSTATALSNIMQAAGKKTGLFISPYVIDFTERIQINGTYIPQSELARLTAEIAPVAEGVGQQLQDAVTEFEFITALAFVYFKEQACDLVVLEVGLGGRLDSTNVILKPLATVITKIALDHVAVLGDTIAAIAAEKCGIIKAGAPVITASSQEVEALRVIRTTAEEKNAPLCVAERSSVQQLKTAAFGSEFVYRDIPLRVVMPGEHQVENMMTAAETALALGIDPAAIQAGIAKTAFPARLEVLQKQPLVLLDGAHNQNGATALADYLDAYHLRPVILLGMMEDKDCAAVVALLASRADGVVAVQVTGNPRAASAETICRMAKEYCSYVTTAEDYPAALEAAFALAEQKQRPLLICGSLYLASDIRGLTITHLK